MFLKNLHRPALTVAISLIVRYITKGVSHSLPLIALSLSACGFEKKPERHEDKILVTIAVKRTVLSTQQYVGQVHASQQFETNGLPASPSNSSVGVYFNVPEVRYLEYMAELDTNAMSEWVFELKLANGKMFPQPGRFAAISAEFNPGTGNIPFRADFPDPDGLLRNGLTGTLLLHRPLENVVIVPQRATYEVNAQRMVYVVDKDKVIHARSIIVQCEQDDIFVIREGLEMGDRIVLDGIRQVHDGDKVDYKFVEPDEVLSLKYHALP